MDKDEAERLKGIAQADQASRGIVQVADQLRQYFDALLDNGFTREEALELTTAYQSSIVASATSANMLDQLKGLFGGLA